MHTMMQLHYDALMRTTIDLPEDLHRVVTAIARDRNATFNATLADLLRRSISPTPATSVGTDPRTGFPIVRVGRTVTSEDVRALEDDM